VYGTTHQLASWNPLWANAHIYWEGLKDMLRTRYPADALRLWVEGPGWRPRDLRDEPTPDWQAPRFDPPASGFARTYTFVQFWFSVAASFAVLLGDFDRTLTLSAAAVLAFWFYTQGAWLEGRSYARALEWLRLAATVAMAWAGNLTASGWSDPVAGWLTGYAAISVAVLLPAGRWATADRRDSLDDASGSEPTLEKPPEAPISSA
jgi:hypothetical protein